MGESKLLLALFCNKILTISEQGVVVVVISWRSGCVTLTVTLQLYRGGECAYPMLIHVWRRNFYNSHSFLRRTVQNANDIVTISVTTVFNICVHTAANN